MAKITGRCLCEETKFSVESVEHAHHACHCGMCRRWAGAPLFATPVTGLTFEDPTRVKRYRSSEWAERGFCDKCGTNLFYYLLPADMYLICVGTFDDPKPFKLTGEIYVDYQPPGYAFAGDLSRETEEEFLAKFQQAG